jgi:hypothetical protein
MPFALDLVPHLSALSLVFIGLVAPNGPECLICQASILSRIVIVFTYLVIQGAGAYIFWDLLFEGLFSPKQDPYWDGKIEVTKNWQCKSKEATCI